MQSESKIKELNPSQGPQINNKLQAQMPYVQSLQKVDEDQTIEKKVQLQLYQHFQQMLSKQMYHYSQDSNFFDQKLSKQQIVNETIKYLNYLKQNINPLPPQHNEQLLFLIDYFNINKRLITNFYLVFSNSTSQAKLKLSFYQINERIDVQKFVSFNWNHLVELSFYQCNWFNDNDWKLLFQHAENFKNLQYLYLDGNSISQIQEGDIEHFKSLQLLNLCDNPLAKESKEILRQYNRNKNKSVIYFIRRW